LHDIEVIKRELPIDLLEFFYLTLLPGSEDHKKLHTAGIPVDLDMNRYDLNHVTTGHPRMSRAEWERIYKLAWQNYYTPPHIETVLRRAAATWANVANALFLITWFKGRIDIENTHPLEGGYLRMKFRCDRRSGLPLEAALPFYPPHWWQSLLVKQVRWAKLNLGLRRIHLRIKHDPARSEYMDLALTPVMDDETETRELLCSLAAPTYVRQEHDLDKFRRNLESGAARAAAEHEFPLAAHRRAPRNCRWSEAERRERSEPCRRNARHCTRA
jgi:hypothetical protein